MSSELNKSQSYAGNDGGQDCIDRMNKRLAGDIRSRMRRICATRPFSDEWASLVDVMVHLGSVATMEERETVVGVPYSALVMLLVQQHRATNDSTELGKSQQLSTIWERSEVCVRIVIEEGKINLLVRSLMDFYAAMPTSTDRDRASQYEVGLGCLVRSSLVALEALQTLDLRALLEHVAVALTNGCKELESGQQYLATQAFALSQHGVVAVSYLAALFAQIDILPTEDMVIEKCLDLNLLQLVLRHFELYVVRALNNSLPSEMPQTALTKSFSLVAERDVPSSYFVFFAGLIKSEGFTTNMAKFFPNRDAKKKFVSVVDGPLTHWMDGADPSVKKAMRPLTDLVLRFK